ncbi:hypothetical protein ACVGOW_11740 [Pseudonocardia saturnea]
MNQPQHPPQYPGHSYPGGPVPPVPPPPRRKRRTWLKVGLVVLAGLIAFSIFGNRGPVRAPDTGGTGVTGAPAAGEVQEAGSLSVFDLQPGDCYNTREDPPLPNTSQPISVVEAVPCTSPHTDQVIAKVTYDETDSLADVLAGQADTDCNAQFEALVDPAALEDPSLLPGRLVPSNADTWSRNRVIACVIFSENPITRSLLA